MSERADKSSAQWWLKAIIIGGVAILGCVGCSRTAGLIPPAPANVGPLVRQATRTFALVSRNDFLSGSKTEKVFKMDQRNGTLQEVEEQGPVRAGQAIAVLQNFLGCLADGDFEGAYALVAPSSKEAGDPIAYNAPLDYESFVKELTPPSIKTIGEGHDEPTNADVRQKFVGYELGVSRWETPTRFRIWVTFQKWDKDEVTLVREGDSWYVADPIHIIR